MVELGEVETWKLTTLENGILLKKGFMTRD
jgi:hypothetical protein